MFQAGEVTRKLLKWRLDIYLSHVASEEEFLSVLNKSELEKKDKNKTSVRTSCGKIITLVIFLEEKIFHKMKSDSSPLVISSLFNN